MKKTKYLGIIITVLVIILGIDIVNAECFMVTKDGKSQYVMTNANQAQAFEKQGATVKRVEDSYCETSSKSNSEPTYCTDIDEPKRCKAGTKNYSCVWNEEYDFCNTDTLTYVSCGKAFDIPSKVPPIVNFIINFLKILTPIVLIFISIITLLKALAASKEDEIKKAQSSLVKKLIAAALVFFVITIVQFVILKVADDKDADNIMSCFSCFLNNDCKDEIYYKTKIGDQYVCTYVNSKKIFTDFPCNPKVKDVE